jgi:DeoR/GlpR family transcriptional regulator of sugar metabolism
VSELTRQLNVSDMTIRRDLEALAERGLLEKVHGGATAIGEHSTDEPGFEAKSYRQRQEKEAIAKHAASRVRPGSAIGVSAGTTTHALAPYLCEVPGITVVTNSIPVADVLYRAGRADQTVVLTGGLRTPSDALVGPFAVSAIRELHLDLIFMGVHGMDARSGFTTPNLMEADTNRALVSAGRRLVVLADHSKWEMVGISSIAALADADVVITDDGLEPEARDILAAEVGELVVVEPDVRAVRSE